MQIQVSQDLIRKEFRIVLSGDRIITQEYVVTPPQAGDVNGDGLVDIVDALLIAQCFVGLIPCPPASVCDVNCDDAVDIVDALLVAQHFVGLITVPLCP